MTDNSSKQKLATLSFKIGNEFFAKKEYLNAINKYQEAIRLNPDYFEALCNMGVCYKNIQQLEKAHDCYTSALKLKPMDASIMNNIGNIFVITNDFAKAADYFSRALEIDPYYKSALENLLEMSLLLGDIEKAMETKLRLERLM